MSLNLLNVLKDQLSDGAMNKLSSLIGENTATTQNALTSFLPTILSSIVDKGSSVSGSVNLLKLISDNNLDNNTLSNLSTNVETDDKSDSWMRKGSKILSGIFGNRQDSILSKLGSLTGLKSASALSLMSMLAPAVMGAIGKIVKSDNLDASGLQRLLTNQKSTIYGALPAGFNEVLGFADHTSAASTSNTQSAAASTATHVRVDENSGGGWWKWLLPLLLLLGGLWWFMNKDKGADADTTKTEMTTDQKTTSAVTSDNHDGHNHAYTFYIDADGNLVDAHGKLVYKAGEYKKDAKGNILDTNGKLLAKAGEFGSKLKSTTSSVTDNIPDVNVSEEVKYVKDETGNLVDKTGHIVYKAGDFTEKDGYYVDRDGKKIGFFGKVGKAIEDAAGAVGGAAEATADAFKGVFTGLFSKKEKKGSTHTLRQITFNPESNRITNYSKPEFEAMVAALKMSPNSKIQVQVYTNDGKDDKENKKLTDMRAEQLKNMMVTLGVNAKQLSHKGMGASNADKAASDKVDIFIEQ